MRFCFLTLRSRITSDELSSAPWFCSTVQTTSKRRALPRPETRTDSVSIALDSSLIWILFCPAYWRLCERYWLVVNRIAICTCKLRENVRLTSAFVLLKTVTDLIGWFEADILISDAISKKCMDNQLDNERRQDVNMDSCRSRGLIYLSMWRCTNDMCLWQKFTVTVTLLGLWLGWTAYPKAQRLNASTVYIASKRDQEENLTGYIVTRTLSMVRFKVNYYVWRSSVKFSGITWTCVLANPEPLALGRVNTLFKHRFY